MYNTAKCLISAVFTLQLLEHYGSMATLPTGSPSFIFMEIARRRVEQSVLQQNGYNGLKHKLMVTTEPYSVEGKQNIIPQYEYTFIKLQAFQKMVLKFSKVPELIWH